MRSSAAPIESCLTEAKKGMQHAMLEIVSTGAVSTPADVQHYIKCTLLAATQDFKEVVASTTIAALKHCGKEVSGGG